MKKAQISPNNSDQESREGQTMETESWKNGVATRIEALLTRQIRYTCTLLYKHDPLLTNPHADPQPVPPSSTRPASCHSASSSASAAAQPPTPILDVAGSVPDVPYALAHGLLTFHCQDSASDQQWVEVDVRRRPNPVVAAKRGSSGVAFLAITGQPDVDGLVSSSILEPGRKYRVRLASEDLGVKRKKHFIVDKDDAKKPSYVSVSDSAQAAAAAVVKFVNSKPSAGNATFTVVKRLSWPPRVETRMRLYICTTTSTLEVSVLNAAGSDPISVQTRGRQRFLIPWGPFQPEAAYDDRGVRIIHATAAPHKAAPPQPQPPTSSLQMIDWPLMDSTVTADRRRPKVEDVLTLRPGSAGC
ncbi:MAG: hypothetical protein M1816_004640 [Peltula sp. TS41687]|nr:MAG: hypothetical protein M1816_004640 [Peltula sp. TS41687]